MLEAATKNVKLWLHVWRFLRSFLRRSASFRCSASFRRSASFPRSSTGRAAALARYTARCRSAALPRVAPRGACCVHVVGHLLHVLPIVLALRHLLHLSERLWVDDRCCERSLNTRLLHLSLLRPLKELLLHLLLFRPLNTRLLHLWPRWWHRRPLRGQQRLQLRWHLPVQRLQLCWHLPVQRLELHRRWQVSRGVVMLLQVCWHHAAGHAPSGCDAMCSR